MTMPHLMNCDHSDTGWCLDCVKAQHDELEKANTKLAKLRAMGEGFFDEFRISDSAFDTGKLLVMSQVMRYLEIER